MDLAKRNALVAELSNLPEPILVPITRFFDGNDDISSFGCNLLEHPGIDVFRDTFADLARRPDVAAIYVRISKVDPGEGCWPFTDTAFVFGSISASELQRILAPLEPDSVSPAAPADYPAALKTKHPQPLLIAWWD